MAEQAGFKRNVGLFMAVMIGIGAMMGPGIFALPSVVAESAGPLAIIAYLAMGLLTLFTALSYSELGAALPIAGGGYSFYKSNVASTGSISHRVVLLDWQHSGLFIVCCYFRLYR